MKVSHFGKHALLKEEERCDQRVMPNCGGVPSTQLFIFSLVSGGVADSEGSRSQSGACEKTYPTAGHPGTAALGLLGFPGLDS